MRKRSLVVTKKTARSTPRSSSYGYTAVTNTELYSCDKHRQQESCTNHQFRQHHHDAQTIKKKKKLKQVIHPPILIVIVTMLKRFNVGEYLYLQFMRKLSYMP